MTTFTRDSASIRSLDDLYEILDAMHMESGWHRKSPALWP